jgi:CubicO group peptidase (beta-lactamase class C family)
MGSLAAAVQPFVDRNYIAGAVLLAATKDQELACEAVGYVDLAEKKPMTPQTMFWIASMTKAMTGTALMMLVDEGRVNVDEPVEKYLPEYKGQRVIAYKDDDVVLLRRPRHPILVREILSHTGGVVAGSPVEAPTIDRLKLSDAVGTYAMLPLQFEPGTRYGYSNGGTNTAGRIIEVASGLAYEDFMDQRLFRPLGMKDTTFWPNEEQLTRLAKVYRTNEQKTGIEETEFATLSSPLDNRSRQPCPAGGLFSTATDCAKFCQMVLRGGEKDGRRYLSEASTRQMTTKQTAPEVPVDYGFGWDTPQGKYAHAGAYKTKMTVDPKLGLITVFLIQHTNDWPNDEAKQIGAAFTAATEKLVA